MTFSAVSDVVCVYNVAARTAFQLPRAIGRSTFISWWFNGLPRSPTDIFLTFGTPMASLAPYLHSTLTRRSTLMYFHFWVLSSITSPFVFFMRFLSAMPFGLRDAWSSICCICLYVVQVLTSYSEPFTSLYTFISVSIFSVFCQSCTWRIN